MNAIIAKVLSISQFTRFIKRALWAVPMAIFLLIVLCASAWAAFAAFFWMVWPAWRWIAASDYYELISHRANGRAFCFMVCVASAWVAGRSTKALRSLWQRLMQSGHAELPAISNNNIRAWARHAARAAAEFYKIGFWIMAIALALGMLIRSALDPAFVPVVKMLAGMVGGYLGSALTDLALQVGALAPALRTPAALLFLSFVPYENLETPREFEEGELGSCVHVTRCESAHFS